MISNLYSCGETIASPNNVNIKQIHSVTIYVAGGSYDIENLCNSIEYLKSKGLKAIQIAIQVNIDYSTYKASKYISDEDLIILLDHCKYLDYKMLKIHQYPLFISTVSENIKLLPSYQEILESYIPILNQYNVNSYCLTNENPNACILELRNYWEDIISSIKSKGYKGDISMSYSMAQLISSKITDLFDILCVNTYPSLSSNEDSPTLTSRVGNWSYYLNKLFTFKTINDDKKLFITETGCQPYNGRLGMPGINQYNTGLNEQVQYDFYEATLPTLSMQEFIDGWSIWECNKANHSYSPIGRKAEKILIEYL